MTVLDQFRHDGSSRLPAGAGDRELHERVELRSVSSATCDSLADMSNDPATGVQGTRDETVLHTAPSDVVFLRLTPLDQLTESRKPTASPAIPDDSSIGTIGVAVKRNHGVHGAEVRANVAALSASMIATPPVPSAKP